jgi:integrase
VVAAHPYLLTTSEIDRFFAAAARLDAHSPWAWQGVAFFTLMHSCGLRTGETRLLEPDRVDLAAGHIDVLWSKGNRSRRLPLTGQVIEILTACDRTARRQFGPSRQTFFVSATGNQGHRRCRPPRGWDHLAAVLATGMGPLASQLWDHLHGSRL